MPTNLNNHRSSNKNSNMTFFMKTYLLYSLLALFSSLTLYSCKEKFSTSDFQQVTDSIYMSANPNVYKMLKNEIEDKLKTFAISSITFPDSFIFRDIDNDTSYIINAIAINPLDTMKYQFCFTRNKKLFNIYPVNIIPNNITNASAITNSKQVEDLSQSIDSVCNLFGLRTFGRLNINLIDNQFYFVNCSTSTVLAKDDDANKKQFPKNSNTQFYFSTDYRALGISCEY